MWKTFLLTLGQGAATGFLGAEQQPGATLTNAGVAAGLAAAAAALQFLFSHPAAQHPVVVAGLAAKVSVSTDAGATFQPMKVRTATA